MRILLICTALLANTAVAFGQKLYTSLTFAPFAPQGEFRESHSSLIGLGARLNIHYRPVKHLPLLLGLNGGLASMNRVRVDFKNNGIISNYYYRTAVSPVPSVGLLLRFQPSDIKPIRAFVEGMAGYNFFQTSSNLWEKEDNSHTRIESKVNTVDNAFYGGLNTGLIFRINEASRAHFLISFAYLVGGKAQYGDNPQFDGLNATWDYKTSRTSMYLTQVGFWVKIK